MRALIEALAEDFGQLKAVVALTLGNGGLVGAFLWPFWGLAGGLSDLGGLSGHPWGLSGAWPC